MNASVIVFPGSNCDRDVKVALEKVTGAPVSLVWHGDAAVPASDLIVLPGGFAYGDYLRTGAMAAHSPDHARRGGQGEGRHARARHLQRLPGAVRGGPAARRADAQRLSASSCARTCICKVEQTDTPFTGRYRPGRGDPHSGGARGGQLFRRSAPPWTRSRPKAASSFATSMRRVMSPPGPIPMARNATLPASAMRAGGAGHDAASRTPVRTAARGFRRAPGVRKPACHPAIERQRCRFVHRDFRAARLFAGVPGVVHHSWARHEPVPGQDFDRRAQGGYCGHDRRLLGLRAFTAGGRFGLSALIAASPTLFLGLKIVGALYLFWLAIAALRTRLRREPRRQPSAHPRRSGARWASASAST